MELEGAVALSVRLFRWELQVVGFYSSLFSLLSVRKTVNHSRGEYVRGDVHTNTVESVFGLFKRSVVGSFHQISEKHLDRYLDEFEFRFNNRKNPFLFRDTLTRLVSAKPLQYETLTA